MHVLDWLTQLESVNIRWKTKGGRDSPEALGI